MAFEISEKLKELPVARKLSYINTEENFILIAHTGSGKTMIIPAYLHFVTGRKILMRQPTRVATRSAYNGLKMFWEPLGFKIGMLTSEDTFGSVDDNDITVVTDGVMTHLLKEPKHKYLCIFDEIHSQMPVTEIEMGIVKTYMNRGQDIQIVLLTATIRPENILNHFESLNKTPQSKSYISMICDKVEEGEIVNQVDQKQFLKAYYTEGVAYPIEKKITLPNTLIRPEMEFTRRMGKEKKRGLIFLCTRREVSELVDDISDDPLLPPALEVHADVDVDRIVKFVDDNIPSVTVATVAMATSVTLPFDEVLIMDSGIDSIYENGIKQTITKIPLDDNGILQRAGRVGRVKPGVATLCSSHMVDVQQGDEIRRVPLRQSWDDIRPVPVSPPLEKLPPDDVVLTCASYGMDSRDLDVLSHLDSNEIEKSTVRLARWGLIEKNGFVKITEKGRRVHRLPLEIRTAVMVVDCPKDIIPAVLAIASMGEGMYHLFKPRVETKDDNGYKMKSHGSILLEDEMRDCDSVLMIKAKILQKYFQLRSEGNGIAKTWVNENGMLTKKIERNAYQWYRLISKGLRWGESKIRREFIQMDLDDIKEDILSYLVRIKVYDRNILEHNDNKGYYHGNWMGIWTMLSGDNADLMQLGYRGHGLEVLGTPRVITKKGGGLMCFWEDVTIVKELRSWEDYDEAMGGAIDESQA